MKMENKSAYLLLGRTAFVAVACVFAAFAASAEMIDVISLGARNDGSVDVSAIVNANTARGSLFFPAGIYKVSHSLVLKNPICGEGYSRVPRIGSGYTWLVSDIVATNAARGVVEFGGDIGVNVENLNIKCKSHECGIRIGNAYGTFAFIDKVGVYNVASYGLFAKGDGSRRVFAQNMTIFGAAADPASRSVGILIAGIGDCRLSNIEVMGVCRGIALYNAHTYGDNLHIWTGLMGKLNESWWHDTRGFVLGDGAHFSGSEIYPDTSYYVFEMGANASCEIANLMYWEDASVNNVKDRTGRFLKYADENRPGKFVVTGGMIGYGGSDKNPGAIATYYMPKATIRDVKFLSGFSIKGENIDKLCLGRQLPDYTVRYADKGWCKVADVFTVANTGACAAILSLDDGSAWRIGVLKGRSGKVEFSVKPLNPLCGAREIRMIEEDGVAKVFIRCDDASPIEARFATTYMCDRFRPLDHASLSDSRSNSRCRDVRESLEGK